MLRAQVDMAGKVWWKRMPKARAGMRTRKMRSISEENSEKRKKVTARIRLVRRPVKTLKRMRENFMG